MNPLAIEYPSSPGLADEEEVVRLFLKKGYAIERDLFLDRTKMIDCTSTRFMGKDLHPKLEWQITRQTENAAKMDEFYRMQIQRNGGSIKIYFAIPGSVVIADAVEVAHKMVQAGPCRFGIPNAITLLDIESGTVGNWRDIPSRVAEIRSRPSTDERVNGTVQKVVRQNTAIIITTGRSVYFAHADAITDPCLARSLRRGEVKVGGSVSFVPTRKLNDSPHFSAEDVQLVR